MDILSSSVESIADPHGILICKLILRMNFSCFSDLGFIHGLSFALESLLCTESAPWSWFLLKKE